MNVKNLVVDILYHVGGLSLTVYSGMMLFKMITENYIINQLGLIIMFIAGLYVGTTIKSIIIWKRNRNKLNPDV